MSTARRPSAGRRPARPASRPGTRVRTTTRPVRPPVPAAAPGPRPRRLTPRTAVLLLVLVGLGLSFALPVREYLAQRSETGAPWYSQLWGTVQSSDRPQR
jgi:hypothetical protein